MASALGSACTAISDSLIGVIRTAGPSHDLLWGRGTFTQIHFGDHFVRFADIELVDQPVQVSTSDTEHTRAFGLPPAAFAQSSNQQPALELANLFFVPAVESRRLRYAVDRRRQVADLNGFALRKDNGPLHCVLELADVARPAVFLQGAQGRL